jgi:hypothetical protein
VRYWRRALRTELGRFGLAAHASAGHEETAALAQELRGIVGERAAPALGAIFRRAGM